MLSNNINNQNFDESNQHQSLTQDFMEPPSSPVAEHQKTFVRNNEKELVSSISVVRNNEHDTTQSTMDTSQKQQAHSLNKAQMSKYLQEQANQMSSSQQSTLSVFQFLEKQANQSQYQNPPMMPQQQVSHLSQRSSFFQDRMSEQVQQQQQQQQYHCMDLVNSNNNHNSQLVGSIQALSLTQPVLNLTKKSNIKRSKSTNNRERKYSQSAIRRRRAVTRDRKVIMQSYTKKKVTKEQKQKAIMKRKLTLGMVRISDQLSSMNIENIVSNTFNNINTQAVNPSTQKLKPQSSQKVSRTSRKSVNQEKSPVRRLPTRKCNQNKKITYNEAQMCNKNIIQEFGNPEEDKKPDGRESRVTRPQRDTVMKQEYTVERPFQQVQILYDNNQEVCDICQGDEAPDADNLFVMCEICNVAVHQSCYGGELLKKVPSGPWICNRCKYCQETNIPCYEIKCDLCPDIKGAMKFFKKENIWAHITCINWIPEVWFKDDKREQICGKYNKQRSSKTYCFNCKQRHGQCIQCDYKHCYKSWHVRCAIRRGVIPDSKKFEDLTENNQESWSVPVFCEKHREKGEKAFMNNDMESIYPVKRTSSVSAMVGKKRAHRQRSSSRQSLHSRQSRQSKSKTTNRQRPTRKTRSCTRKTSRTSRVSRVSSVTQDKPNNKRQVKLKRKGKTNNNARKKVIPIQQQSQNHHQATFRQSSASSSTVLNKRQFSQQMKSICNDMSKLLDTMNKNEERINKRSLRQTVANTNTTTYQNNQQQYYTGIMQNPQYDMGVGNMVMPVAPPPNLIYNNF